MEAWPVEPHQDHRFAYTQKSDQCYPLALSPLFAPKHPDLVPFSPTPGPLYPLRQPLLPLSSAPLKFLFLSLLMKSFQPPLHLSRQFLIPSSKFANFDYYYYYYYDHYEHYYALYVDDGARNSAIIFVLRKSRIAAYSCCSDGLCSREK
jgi:hypothetical protein